MVNVGQQGVVSFEGRGYTHRKYGGYLPGEFARMVNCELTPHNSIRSRPGILSIPNATAAGTTTVQAQTKQFVRKFIGHMGRYAMAGSHFPNANTTYYMKGPGNGANTVVNKIGPDAENCKIYWVDPSTPATIAAGYVLFADGATYTDNYDSLLWHPYVIEGFQDYRNQVYYILSGVLSKITGSAYTYRKGVIAIATPQPAYQNYVKDPEHFITVPATGYDIRIIYETDIINQTNQSPNFYCSGLPAQQTKSGEAYANNVLTHFMYKERLYIVTPEAVIFSAATDPFEWRVSQHAGLVKLAEPSINWACPCIDGVYVFSPNAIDLITFNTDFNVDGQVIRVSDNLGADCGVEYQGYLYFAVDDALFRMIGSRITKVTDLNLGIEKAEGSVGAASYTYRMWVYYNYFIIGLTVKDTLPYDTLSPPIIKPDANLNEYYYKGYSSYYRPTRDTSLRIDGLGFEMPTTFFMMNIDTGALSELCHCPSNELLQPGQCTNQIQDIMIVPEGANNQTTMYIMSGGDVDYAQDTSLPIKYQVKPSTLFFYMQPLSEERNPTFHLDSIVSGVFSPAPPNPINMTLYDTLPTVDFIIRDFAPDGSEYFIKKYRRLLIQAILTKTSPKVIWFCDDYYPAENPTTSFGPSTSPTQPSPFAIGLNQRGFALHMRFYIPQDKLAPAVTQAYWEITDIRTLWTYTGRGVSKRDAISYP